MKRYTAGQVIDRFEVLAFLGEGATAQVYRVRHPTLGTDHALKLLTSTRHGLRHRLLQEGQVQARLRHDNVVAVSDIIEHDGHAGLVMEFIGGASLEAALSRHGRMAPDEALDLFLPILDGIEAAHSAGVLHRDLKPANILLQDTAGGVVPKVTDFGIAKVLNEESSSLKGRTRAGLAMGTPGYMAPEQWADSSSVDARADIFSLGVVLYEMLAGRLPYTGNTSLDLLGATMSGTPAPLSAIAPATPAAIIAAIERALLPDPSARFADVAAFREALLADALPEPPPEPKPAAEPPTEERSRSLAWMAGLTGLTALVGLVGLAGLVVVGVGAVWWLSGEDDPLEAEGVVNTPVSLGSFSMDRTEVSYAEYQACRLAGACTPLRRQEGDSSYAAFDVPGHPVVGVDWTQASAYCAWRSGRLPTEEEWEQAARGAPVWPWGKAALSCKRANHEGCPAGGTVPTGSMAAGESADGIRHLIGNVWEWTATPGEASGPRLFTQGTRMILRGGGWGTAASDLANARYPARKTRTSNLYGFRCVY